MTSSRLALLETLVGVKALPGKLANGRARRTGAICSLIEPQGRAAMMLGPAYRASRHGINGRRNDVITNLDERCQFSRRHAAFALSRLPASPAATDARLQRLASGAVQRLEPACLCL
jgi:hypothetical protein